MVGIQHRLVYNTACAKSLRWRSATSPSCTPSPMAAGSASTSWTRPAYLRHRLSGARQARVARLRDVEVEDPRRAGATSGRRAATDLTDAGATTLAAALTRYKNLKPSRSPRGACGRAKADAMNRTPGPLLRLLLAVIDAGRWLARRRGAANGAGSGVRTSGTVAMADRDPRAHAIGDARPPHRGRPASRVLAASSREAPRDDHARSALRVADDAAQAGIHRRGRLTLASASAST